MVMDVSQFESRVAIDVTDLRLWLRHTATFTGIQRVIAGFIEGLRRHGRGLELVYFCLSGDESTFVSVAEEPLLDLIRQVSGDGLDRARLDASLAGVFAGREAFEARAGDAIVVAGAYWWVLHPLLAFFGDAKSRGARIFIFTHDIIPLTHPDLGVPEYIQMFLRGFLCVAGYGDVFLTNSVFVAGEVESTFRRLDVAAPVRAVPLVHSPLGACAEAPSGTDAMVRQHVRDLAARRFVLNVGTINARKNHLYLHDVWELWLRRAGKPPPRLVVVGQWAATGIRFSEKLHASGGLNGHIVVLEDVSDAELEHLYRRCLFTVLASLTEGWGLPVGESLAHGKLAICARAASLPEVGGTFAAYFDPSDIEDGLRVLRQYSDDARALRRAEQRIAETFVARTWDDVAADLVRAFADTHGAARVLPQPVAVTAGRYVPVGLQDADPRDLAAARSVVNFMICAENWSAPEAWGVWSTAATARLGFRVEGWEAGAILVRAIVTAPPLAGPLTVRLLDGAGPGASVEVKADDLAVVGIETTPQAGGLVDLTLSVEGAPLPAGAARSLWAGLLGLGVAAAASSADILKLADALIAARL